TWLQAGMGRAQVQGAFRRVAIIQTLTPECHAAYARGARLGALARHRLCQGQAEERSMSKYRRRNQISAQWSPRLIEMLRSPAYRALSLSAHRLISRIEIELADHGGNDNGKLPVTKQDFIDYGISPRLVAPAKREAEALGFIRETVHGSGG